MRQNKSDLLMQIERLRGERVFEKQISCNRGTHETGKASP